MGILLIRNCLTRDTLCKTVITMFLFHDHTRTAVHRLVSILLLSGLLWPYTTQAVEQSTDLQEFTRPPALYFSTKTPNVVRPKVHEKKGSSKLYRQASDFRQGALVITQLWYPFIRQLLWTNQSLPSDANIVLQYEKSAKDSAKVATTYGNTITIYDRYTGTDAHQRTGGVLIHEMVHLLQHNYMHIRAVWMSEAIADYIRFAYYEGWGINRFLKKTHQAIAASPNGVRERFRENFHQDFDEKGYTFSSEPVHAAGMLHMIATWYYPGIVEHMHRVIAQKTAEGHGFSNVAYSDELYQLTGRTLDQLWCEYIARASGDRNKLHRCYPQSWSEYLLDFW